MFWKTVLANKNKKGKKRRGNTVNKIAIYSCFVFTLLFLFFRVVGKFFPAKRYYSDKFKEHNENTRTVIIVLRSLYHLSEFPLLLFLFFCFLIWKSKSMFAIGRKKRRKKERQKTATQKNLFHSFIHSFPRQCHCHSVCTRHSCHLLGILCLFAPLVDN